MWMAIPVDDIFDRDKLMDFLGELKPIVRLKGVFRCRGNWWAINRAKEATDLSTDRKYQQGEQFHKRHSVCVFADQTRHN